MPNPTPLIEFQVRQPGSTTTNTLQVPCWTTIDTDGRTVLPHRAASALGELTIDWGRTDVWSQPDPSVATVHVWQSDAAAAAYPTYNLAKATAGSGMVGRTFRIRVPKGAGHYYIFQGRTTNVDAERLSVRTERGIEPGWLLRVQASDRTGGLAQVDKQGFRVLNAGQTMKWNADFLNAFGSWAGIRETYFEADYQNGKCRKVDMTDKTIYDLITEMYASFAHQFTYNPRRNVVIRIPAGYNYGPYTLQLGRTAVGGTVRLYAPRWVDNTGREDPQDSDPYPSGYIGGNQVGGDVRISSDQVQAISHLECKWWVSASNADHISRVRVLDSENLGLLRFDSWFSDGLQVDPIMLDVKRKCLNEGSRPYHPTVTWDTSVTGEVPDWNTFESLTLPAQTVRMVVVAGSPFSAMMGYPPMWHPAGGVIAYADGEWKFTTHLAPAPHAGTPGDPIRFTGLSNSTTGRTLTLGQLDQSISSWDMRYCSDPQLYIYE